MDRMTSYMGMKETENAIPSILKRFSLLRNIVNDHVVLTMIMLS